jgi:hypothetical protein
VFGAVNGAHYVVTMAKIHLVSLFPGDAGSWELGPFNAFLKSAETSSNYELVADPHAADLIFFTDEGRHGPNDVYNTPLYRAFWDRCFIFCQRDRPIPLIPGLYSCIEQGDYDRDWCRSGFYAHEYKFDSGKRYITQYDQIPFPKSAKYLCSFAGSCQNARIRAKLKEMSYPRCLVIDVNRETNTANTTGDQKKLKLLEAQFIELLRNSKFSLCPRGVGTNSIRLYESMAIGRAPVILSDAWIAPLEIPWDAFSIRIAERDYKLVPKILEREEHRAEELGQRARRAWEQYFQPEVIFDRAVSTFFDIRASGRTTKWYEHQFRRLRMLPKILRCILRDARLR